MQVHIDKELDDFQEIVLVEVEDNGVGFDTVESKRSFGLQSMRERAYSVQGELSVVSAYGEGTRVKLRLPCLEQENLNKRSLVLSDR